jgi:opine dehydrogenase
MDVKRVAILGAGNGGITAAAHVKSMGFEVSLFELPEYGKNLNGIKEKGGILFKKREGGEQFITPDLVTTDIKEAVEGAQIIMLTIPGFAIETFAEILAPVVSEDQIIFFNGAAAMACIRFVNKAAEMGINKKFKIAEANSLTYGTRAFHDEAVVEMSLYVNKLYFAAYPSSDTEELLEACIQVYDCLVPAINIWETTLANGNPEVHPGPCLLNAGRIEYSKGEFWLYKEGITKHTANIIKAIEKERLALGAKLGFELEGAALGRATRGYFSSSKGELYELFNNSEVFSQIKGPLSVNSRYFTEDISTGLVLWSSIGKAIGVKTDTIDSVIILGQALLQRNFYDEGISLESLGLEGMDIKELIKTVS